LNRAAPGLADAVHFTGGWLPHEVGTPAIAPSMAARTAGCQRRFVYTAEFLRFTFV
jgi:hypothetical protein